MSNKKQDQPLANAQNRQRADQKQISFFKSKLSGLSPLNKFSPFKESSTYQLFNKNYASVDFTQQKQPLFKSIKQRSKHKELSSFDSQRSPHKSPNTSNYSSRQTTQKKDYTSRIQQVKRQEQKIPYDSLKSQNIYIESQKSISQALKQYQKPEDMQNYIHNQEIDFGIKKLNKKREIGDLERCGLGDQTNRQISIKNHRNSTYSPLLQQTNDQEELKKQYQKMTQDEHLSIEKYGETISKYNKAIQLLHELQIDYDSLLPELQNDQTEESLNKVQQEENKDETILLQQFIIKKLVNKIEESKSLNQQLISKIKQ